MICDWSTMGVWGGAAMVLAWLAVVGVLAWLVAAVARGSPPGGPSATAILDARFARGELGPEEYLDRRSVLEET
jgi:uncharacterized membrane protein